MVFLNDLESFMANYGATGINLDLRYDQLIIFLKMFMLLSADDTVIFGTDENHFQNNLDSFFEYATTWKLYIRCNKTKIMILVQGMMIVSHSSWLLLPYQSVNN